MKYIMATPLLHDIDLDFYARTPRQINLVINWVILLILIVTI